MSARQKTARPAAATTAQGFLEAAARLPSGAGWLLLGWTSRLWAETEAPDRLYAALSFGNVTGTAATAFFPRTDVPAGATGFCTVLSGPSPDAAHLVGVEVPSLGLKLGLVQRDDVVSATDLSRTCRRAIRAAKGASGHPVLEMLARPAYEGRDTVAGLWPPLHLELDQAIRVPADGLAISGWLLDPSQSLVALRLCSNGGRVALDRSQWISFRRPDIFEQFGVRYGLDDDRFGLLAYVPGVTRPGSEPYLELETQDGEIAYKPIRVIDRPGIGAIKQFLSVARPLGRNVQSAFEHVLGPITQGLNSRRLARTPSVSEATFGQSPENPRVSVIIPLYERLDLMEYQLALLSERPDPTAEILYILDDPRLEREAERLAPSCWARFRLPFRLLTVSENLGFAPANNLGLHAAKGEYACLLNSDVFPLEGAGLSWLGPLVQHLHRDPTLGVVGPLLLYADGTVQHQGMEYERMPGLGNWAFPIHTHKGGPAPTCGSRFEVRAVTGACMVFRREQVLRTGGLDEGYLIGDFEDADLCERLRTEGLHCSVDPTQRLLHLERQSQGNGEPWRANATLYNSWRFNRRWAADLDGAA